MPGNKPVPDDSRDVGGKDNSLVCRAPGQSQVSLCCWAGSGPVPSPGESPGFGKLGQALDELCQQVNPSTSLQQPWEELKAFVDGSACALLSPGHCRGLQENSGMMQSKDSPASGIWEKKQEFKPCGCLREGHHCTPLCHRLRRKSIMNTPPIQKLHMEFIWNKQPCPHGCL